MEYQKIINLLDGTTNQPSKFRTRNVVEIHDELRGKYDNSSITFKTSMIRSNLFDYSDAYILVRTTITITGGGDDDAAKRADERNKGVTIKNCAPFTYCINNINNTQKDNAENIVVVMPMYNLIEYIHHFLKHQKVYGNFTEMIQMINITESGSFKSKIKITGIPPIMGKQKMYK